jgi:DNA (cytosine-5)-methyltransferase 1
MAVKKREKCPLALDLFCGAGGASMGLHRAGFDVIGIDIKPQPRYPFPFIRGDALRPPVDLGRFDFVWASPVCKRYTDGAQARMAKGADYPDQIPAVRELLARHSLWAIENVMKAPLRPDIVLHGHMFPELRVIRRRKFEVSWGGLHLTPSLPKGLLRQGYFCVVGNGTPKGVREMGLPDYTADQTRAAMGTPWMTKAEVCQAIPPAYSEFIGRAALRYIEGTP